MIPKILHFIWMQGVGEMLPQYRQCVDSWAPKHPGWEVKIWDRDTLPPLENSWVLDNDNPTIQAEIVRFDLVLRFGGIYLDADTECLRPLDDLVEGKDAFSSMRNKRVLENNGFGATVEHPWMRDVVETLSRDREKIKMVLDVDRPFAKVTAEHLEVPSLPFWVLHASDNERDRIELHHKAHAIHHRFKLWMLNDDRYREYYEHAHGGVS